MADESQEPVEQPDKFYAVVLHSDGRFLTEEFDTADDLVERLKALTDQDVSVSCFMGARLPISKPPFRHLLTPWGAKPLFNVPATLEPDDTGYLGVDPINLQDPPQLKMPTQNRPAPGSPDEFFDDGDDKVLGVFDDVLPDPDS